MSNIIRKIDQAVHPERHQQTTTTTTGPAPIHGNGRTAQGVGYNNNTAAAPVQQGGNAPEGTYGPHSSRLANALDPRVDSDADGRGQYAGGGGGQYAGGGGGQYAGGAATGQVPQAAEGTYGPHSTRVGNRVDPRVDSDGDNRGAYQTRGAAAAGGARTANTAQGPGAAEGTYGPHSSRLANALDPRVDSDADNMTAGAPAGTQRTTRGAGLGGAGQNAGAGGARGGYY